MSDIILEARDLGMRFGRFQALANVSTRFRRGELCAIIGPNGAGKSTFFNILSGSLAPTSGSVLFRGEDVTALPQHAYARLGIAKSFQITNVFRQLSARENVRVAAQMRATRFDFLRPRSAWPELTDKADALLEGVGLANVRERTAADLAHGQQRALEIAMALAADPQLLLLDEPTAGMSPEETTAMMDLIAHLATERTVILVEHKMKMVMGLCRRLLVLHHGELLADGTPESIRANDEVRRVYLGQG
ncbi:ABC transporter ATP-binding protein [Ramlibacter sp.]|uniref:ABC transporter ATP-binding protein n=1 Tax=Ramlibacter sp. TaxID=1917967 RepID=UPI002607FFCD|nr:ABC transporter ATP-binding protein [Ramlibacter sp.]MDB5958460.1 ABC-type branched-chain amino acid transport system, ATPase component [Ramlibacter sp.]